MKVIDCIHVPAALTPVKKALGTYLIGGSLSPSVTLEAVEKRKKISCSFRESNTDSSAIKSTVFSFRVEEYAEKVHMETELLQGAYASGGIATLNFSEKIYI
jgi:hypothetical protein